MVVHSRKYRMVVVACLCVALTATQIVTVNADVQTQIQKIGVTRTITKFVSPVSQTGLAHLEALSRFANLLTPISELPESDWLEDDSTPPVLAIHTAESAIGDMAVAEGDACWKFAVASFMAGTALFSLGLALATIPTTPVAVGITASTAVAFALAGLNEVARERDERKAEQREAEAERREAEREADKQNAANLLNTATVDEDTIALLDAVDALLVTDEAAVAEWNQWMTQGAHLDKKKVRTLLAQKKREMMLSFELDAAVVASR